MKNLLKILSNKINLYKLFSYSISVFFTISCLNLLFPNNAIIILFINLPWMRDILFLSFFAGIIYTYIQFSLWLIRKAQLKHESISNDNQSMTDEQFREFIGIVIIMLVAISLGKR